MDAYVYGPGGFQRLEERVSAAATREDSGLLLQELDDISIRHIE
jgi:hypothetical protein